MTTNLAILGTVTRKQNASPTHTTAALISSQLLLQAPSYPLSFAISVSTMLT
jgi:hypothetical protein